MPHSRSVSMTLALAFAIALAVLGSGGRAEAGPFPMPGGIPIVAPLPPTPPAIGSIFTAQPGPEGVCAPVCTLWEITVAHLGPGMWFVDDPAVIQDSPFPDHLRFRVPLNNVPPPGSLPPWNLFLEFGANPWGYPAPFAFQIDSLNPFFITQAVPEPFAIGAWAYNVILTDSAGVVLDALDPVLVTGTTLPPTVPSTVVPEPATLFLLGGGMIALATRLAHRRTGTRGAP